MNLEIKFAGKDHRWIFDPISGDIYATCKPEHAEAVKAAIEGMAPLANGNDPTTTSKEK